MKSPNIFEYATSELSQDAFICWLLDWARPELAQVDEKLNGCAKLLIGRLFEKHDLAAPSLIQSVSVRRQVSNIDVLCKVNGEYVIVIEDKTATRNHSGQLVTYLEKVQAMGVDREKIVPIYFKTYDQSCYKKVNHDGYREFLRDDFIQVLEFGIALGVSNPVFTDFYAHLCGISKRVGSYLTEPVESWICKSLAWVGFYKWAQKSLGGGAWDYVANPSGGFMGFWWAFQETAFGKIYLQLEENRLCIKIKVDAQDGVGRKKTRAIVFNALTKRFASVDDRFVRPTRFGSGKYMTLLVCDGYLKADGNGLVDLESTLVGLKRAEAALKYLHLPERSCTE